MKPQIVPPDTEFTMAWRVKNAGKEIWNSFTKVVYELWIPIFVGLFILFSISVHASKCALKTVLGFRWLKDFLLPQMLFFVIQFIFFLCSAEMRESGKARGYVHASGSSAFDARWERVHLGQNENTRCSRVPLQQLAAVPSWNLVWSRASMLNDEWINVDQCWKWSGGLWIFRIIKMLGLALLPVLQFRWIMFSLDFVGTCKSKKWIEWCCDSC